MQAGGANSQVVGNSVHDISRFCNSTIRGQTGVFAQHAGVVVENNRFYSIGRFDPGENGCSYPGGFNKFMNSDSAVYLQDPAATTRASGTTSSTGSRTAGACSSTTASRSASRS